MKRRALQRESFSFQRLAWIVVAMALGMVRAQGATAGAGVSDLVAIGDGPRARVLFVADDGIHGRKLWASDGTPEGSLLVKKDVDVFMSLLTVDPVSDRVFFAADDGSRGVELWVSDGTGEGTRVVKDIAPGADSSILSGFGVRFAAAGGRFFFAADDGEQGEGLWVSDGTEGGTELVKAIQSPELITAVGERVFFSADDGVHGFDLWVSDGTEGGTRLVKDIGPGIEGSWLWSLTAVGDRLFFPAYDGVHGSELWVSDGTEGGTQLVKDIFAGPGFGVYCECLGFHAMKAVGDRLFFPAYDGVHGSELWVSDGTEEGTRLVKDILPGERGSIWDPFIGFAAAGDRCFFPADDGVHGLEFWVSDGTIQGTVPFRDVLDMPLSWYAGPPVAAGGLLFLPACEGAHGCELWVSDWTAAGTRMVKDIAWGPQDSLWPFRGLQGELSSFALPVGERVFFPADDGVHGLELWVSDGTEDGTRLVKDINTLSLFLRGDSNTDSELDITDAIFTLGYLFLGGQEPQCLDAVDADDTGVVDITDAVYILTFLFLPGPSPEQPFAACGIDPTIDELSCGEFSACD